MPSLTPGANSPLPSASKFTLRLATSQAHADLVVLCVDADGRAEGENGVALWTQPECANGAVRIDTATDTAIVNVAALPADVVRVLVVAQADGVADMSACGPLSAEIAADGASAAKLAVADSPAMPTVQVAEFYRHRTGWKIRCLGDGYQDGLARLLQVHGIDVDDEPQARQPVDAKPRIALTKGEEKLPVDMRKRLSLRKEAVRVTLQKKGLGGVRARVILVMDASGSMVKLYKEGTMAAVVERMMAVAAQLDDDGEMEAWTFASECAQLPSLQLGEMPEWIPTNVRYGSSTSSASPIAAHAPEPSSSGLFKRRQKEKPSPSPSPVLADGAVDWDRLGWGNEEQKVIADITGFVKRNRVADPTLVLFFSDGGVYNDEEIERALRKAVRAPIFWQFIGLGSTNGYGVLERFDTLTGREVDNVGFFAVDDIDVLADAELYDRLLSEFPQWLVDARKAGILR